MIIINDVLLPLDTDFSDLKYIASKELKTDISNILSASLYRKSIDARRRKYIFFCCSIKVEVLKDEDIILNKCKKAIKFEQKKYVWQKISKYSGLRPIVVGFGPAGMFASLTLARAGLKPLVIERGKDVEGRTADVKKFFDSGILNPESNVQFGEGGAGTFSDGKLNTGIKNPRCRTVLEVLYEHGAPYKILIDAKPHIGTDILVNIVKSIREEIISLGGDVKFNTKLEKINICDEKITSIVAGNEEIFCDNLVLATGHSARDTFRMLKSIGAELQKKSFAMGVRIEHLQSDINRAMYGEFAESEFLGAADYKIWTHLPSGRGVYSFCMCPGGEVINASSDNKAFAINGMSNSCRDGQNANSALLVNVEPTDFDSDDVLAGCELQEKIERKAYEICGGYVPVTTVGSFVFGETPKIERVKPTVKPNYSFCNFTEIFPNFIVESLREGILIFDNKISGFAHKEAILTAPETRSSSPVRIMRDINFEATRIKGLYPCGEGAGYAGGIVSSAVDGMTVAEKIILRKA